MAKLALIVIPALSIVAHQDVRYRAGRQFTREETIIPIEELDEEEIEKLQGDPLLTVTDTEIEVEGEEEADPSDAAPPPPPPPPPAGGGKGGKAK